MYSDWYLECNLHSKFGVEVRDQWDWNAVKDQRQIVSAFLFAIMKKF